MATPNDAGREDGFTIAEVLVAFMIAALGTILALEIAGMTAGGVQRLERRRVAADESEGVVLRLVAAGGLRPGLIRGRFSDGTAWVLGVSDARPALGLERVPPLWRLRLTRDEPAGPLLYTTLMPEDPDG
ncbi:type II secretion system protein [Methylobacterium gregans]|uniref:General secretion pathway protein I n=1 Tax=Methylobacterium gregans TaxID=374424 RepID=A0AA37HPQ9_9HYPH|nr:type II secretion system protein [Methylobacterium gregans]MDQ0521839.1 general secretion pathway protein I [Methylobacterium gregans]GJD79495.1 hypothetical protein NBEOAGPD_2722 [Methylobacterium gregans]GLS52094.1 hypothetical protein GCM10007886_02760 [Methylobacterium gregans]